jgi:hypothetical protein
MDFLDPSPSLEHRLGGHRCFGAIVVLITCDFYGAGLDRLRHLAAPPAQYARKSVVGRRVSRLRQ